MSTASSAERYAIALYEMSRDANAESTVYSNACDFLKLYNKSNELRTALSHPSIQRSERSRVMDEILSRSSYDRLFSNFLRVLSDRGRVSIFPKIVSEYEVIRDKASGRIRATVYVAETMTPTQKANLKSKVESQLKHEVVLQERIEPSIIGGFRLELQGRVYDNSIKRHMERLRDEMHVSS